MTRTATAAAPQDRGTINLPDQPLSGEIADYISYLVAQHRQTPLALSIKLHPLNVTEGLMHELAAHERDLLRAGNKQIEHEAAHECADPHYPHENVLTRHVLADLIAEMVAPLAEATLAHHLRFVLTFGSNLPPPHAIDRMAICASFDSTHAILRQRFAPEREIAPPSDEPPITAGMTLVCEALETGYYRIPDDKRYRNSSGLLHSDNPLYQWTMQALVAFYTLQGAYNQLAPDQIEIAAQLSRQIRSVFRFLALRNPEMTHCATFMGIDPGAGAEAYGRTETPSQSKIIVGRFASTNGAAEIRNYEHQAGGQMLDRHNPAFHQPEHHTHIQGTDFTPE